jgi:RNA polymerase primary sigma factor
MKPMVKPLPISFHSRNHRLSVESASTIYHISKFCEPEPPTREEEAELFRRFRSGDMAARDELVIRNQRFVVKVATHFASWAKMPLDDLIQAANIGLLEAIDAFDPSQGVRFITFAVWRLRSKLQRETAKISRTVTVPPHSHVALTRYRNAISELVGEGHRYEFITTKQLVEKTGVSECYIEAAKALSLPADTLNRPRHTESGKDDEIAYLPSPETITEDLENTLNRELVARFLSDLPEREADILRLRFGVDDGVYRTFDEVGEIHGISRERVRQIIEQVISWVAKKKKFAYLREAVA